MLVKAFRLFVSSTFKDFAEERELLQTKVFPALASYCSAKGYQFHAIDLRWGVSEEAQLDQRTADICLGEVDAVKGYPPPNFLIMIADHYGWVPLPFAIAQDEFEAIGSWLTKRGEIGALDGLRTVYRLDHNHLIAPSLLATVEDAGQLISAYTLRSRQDDLAALAPADAWGALEEQIRGALQAAANYLATLGEISGEARAKYFLSLTEQEVIRGLSARRGMNWQDRQPSLIQVDQYAHQAIAWIREAARPGKDVRLREPQVEALKVRLRRTLPADCVVTARTTTSESAKLDHAYLDNFASTLQRKLQAVVDRHIAAYEEREQADDFELRRERAEHRAFGGERQKVFVGRESNRAAIAAIPLRRRQSPADPKWHFGFRKIGTDGARDRRRRSGGTRHTDHLTLHRSECCVV